MNENQNPEPPAILQLSAKELEERAEEFFNRKLLERIKVEGEEYVLAEGVIDFVLENLTQIDLSEETSEKMFGIFQIFDGLARQMDWLDLPMGSDAQRLEMSKKRKTVALPTSLLSVQDVMSLIKMSENFVYNLIKTGQLKAYWLSSRAIRVSPQSVQKFLQSRALPSL